MNIYFMALFSSMIGLVFGKTIMTNSDSASPQAHQALNRLAHEASPYLKLHADNPVDWYPWGEEAFAKARKQDKPIFLSIGYSTCHWCHVMARESFASQEIADLLNKYFVSIKIDREERPDIDQLYMTSYQAIVGEGGGWPLNVFLTPELKMFTGGTYFPPIAKGGSGRIGFDQLLINISQAWAKDGDKIKTHSEQNYAILEQKFKQDTSEQTQIDDDLVQQAATQLESYLDKENGGWNPQGPKFPEVSNLNIMLRAYKASGNKAYLNAVILTADKMLYGGIYDQLAGGFHRYSVDGEWLVPHFEKMLYDQAQLVDLYLDLWLITQNPQYKRIVEETATYVMREMQHEQGGYYSAQDAQSEHKEGKFCCWTTAELAEVLTKDEYHVVVNYYGLSEEGNFYDFSDPEALKNQNVLSIVAEKYFLDNALDQAFLDSAKTKMIKIRAHRVPAATDDKVLASWNGMMIAAMARAGVVLNQPEHSRSAQQAYEFILDKLWDDEQQELNHGWCDEVVNDSQQASSYFAMLRAARTLYQTTLEPNYLDMAIILADTAYPLFVDEEQGGFYESADTADVVLRLKGNYDGAIPESGSVASLEYRILGEITGKASYIAIAKRSIMANSAALTKQPHSLSYLLNTVDYEQSQQLHLVITGEENSERSALIQASLQSYQPNLVIMGNQGQVDGFSQSLTDIDNVATAYLCEDQHCNAPTNDVNKLKELLNNNL